MSVSPEQQLRSYVEYFRELGVYELYQRESPQVGVPERWRELLARPRPAQAPTSSAAKPAAASSQREMPQARPAASVAKSPMQPVRPTQAQIPQNRVEPEPPGALEIEEQLHLGRQLHRQVGRLLAMENAAAI